MDIPQIGQIRVGRRIYDRNGKYFDPTFPGFTQILVLTKSTAYGSLGPYELFDERGRNMENLWQFSKVYLNVPAVKEFRSRYDRTVIWEHPAEEHVRVETIRKDNGSVEKVYKFSPAYMRWREKGMKAKEAIRYPVGFNARHTCLFSFAEDENGEIVKEPLDYIKARKRIYSPVYCRLVREKPQFKELQDRLRRGENLLIIEVDLCHEEDLPYYIKTYGVSDDFIQRGTMLATRKNLSIMLNDTRHSYGHGYVLAGALQNFIIE